MSYSNTSLRTLWIGFSMIPKGERLFTRTQITSLVYILLFVSGGQLKIVIYFSYLERIQSIIIVQHFIDFAGSCILSG